MTSADHSICTVHFNNQLYDSSNHVGTTSLQWALHSMYMHHNVCLVFELIRLGGVLGRLKSHHSKTAWGFPILCLLTTTNLFIVPLHHNTHHSVNKRGPASCIYKWWQQIKLLQTSKLLKFPHSDTYLIYQSNKMWNWWTNFKDQLGNRYYDDDVACETVMQHVS